MKTFMHIGIAALTATLVTSSAFAVDGTITINNSKRTGDIKWSARDKAYVFKEKGSAVELTMKPDEISDIQVQRPKELDTAIAAIQQGNAASVVSVLEKLAAEYLMLQWDKVATRYLAEALVQSGKVDEALRVCEKVIAADPEAAYLGEMAPAYWQALIKKDRASKAEELLGKAISSGDRLASAHALIARGDMIWATGDTAETARKALRDGYLRVITLYKLERAAQPEALYKSALCFEKIGRAALADQMRTQLKGEFGASEWARK